MSVMTTMSRIYCFLYDMWSVLGLASSNNTSMYNQDGKQRAPLYTINKIINQEKTIM